MFKRDCENLLANSGQQNQPTNVDGLNFPLPNLYITDFLSEKIHSFRDKRKFLLWLPDVLMKVFPEYSYMDVFTASQYFRIRCSKCSPAQLKCLKLFKLIREDDDSACLISKSEVHRLRRRIADMVELCQDPPFELGVYHEGLGRCDGLFLLSFHLSRYAPCIRCQICFEMMSPQEFVLHAHDTEEYVNYIQDFDPNKWWEYIHLNKSLQHRFLAQRMLNELKFRFSGISPKFSTCEESSEQPVVSDTRRSALWLN